MPNWCENVAIALGAIAALAIVVIFIATKRNAGSREGFANDPAQNVYRAARELFGGNSSATYSDYKAVVPGADPVQFADIRNLWLSGQLSIDTVRRAL